MKKKNALLKNLQINIHLENAEEQLVHVCQKSILLT